MKPFRQNNYPLWPLYLLLFVFPLAVAGQNIGVVISFLAMFSYLLTETDKKVQKNEVEQDFSKAPSDLTILLIATSAYVIWMCLATQFAEDNPGSEIAAYLVGFIPFIVMPPLARAVYKDFSNKTLEKLWKLLTYLMAFCAIVALTQYFFEWHRHVKYFNANSHRSQGLYSHPLTFAYISLAIWPMALIRLLNKTKSRSSWVFFISMVICLWSSESRTVQITAVGLFVFNIFNYLPGKKRILAMLALAGLLAAVAFTDNPLSQKYKTTFAPDPTSHEEKIFPFDRVAFWKAHLHLVSQSPIYGHGVHIPTDVRLQAYEDIGLSTFPKKYTAHNMFLQVAAEGGLIGLILFCFWYFGYIYVSFKNAKHSRLAAILGQSLLALGIAGMTQNAFQDSEVRHVIMILIILFWCNHDRIVLQSRNNQRAIS